MDATGGATDNVVVAGGTNVVWLAVVKEKQRADECIREGNRVVVVRGWLSTGVVVMQ